MSTSSKQIDERLPYLSLWERERLHDLLTAESEQDWPRYEVLKDSFIKHLSQELIRYRSWQASAEERLSLKRKFLNMTGIWDVIPHTELKDMIGQVDGASKRPLLDQIANPWAALDQATLDECEISATDLKYCEPFASFLNRFEKEDGITYLDYLSGSREKRLHPFSDTICFRRSLEALLVAKGYVSTSADPLTRTIYIALSNADGKRRDLISVCYELVLENAFLDFYRNWPGAFQPYYLLRNMTIIALRFLAAVLEWMAERRVADPSLRWLDPYLPEETFLRNPELYQAYLTNLKEVFLRSNLLKIVQLNRRLGFPESDLGINF